MMIDVEALIEMHDCAIERWKKIAIIPTLSAADCVLKASLQEKEFLGLAEENHGFNYQLWCAEDRARRDDKGYEFVYWAKREIDWCNQQRNDRVEQMDEWITEHFCPAKPASVPIHSETPGMIIDRLSILSLKIYHMAIQAHRDTADVLHREQCYQKWQILVLQRRQLADCLMRFFEALLNKSMTFCTYRQFKMYNDKSLNPELYTEK
jgi:hypothetical protein